MIDWIEHNIVTFAVIVIIFIFIIPSMCSDNQPYVSGCVYGIKKNSGKEVCVEKTPKFYWGSVDGKRGKSMNSAAGECERYLVKRHAVLSREKGNNYHVNRVSLGSVLCD